MKIFHLPTLGFAALTGVLLSVPASAVVSLETVTIGNPGNAADPATGSLYGAVSYAYDMREIRDDGFPIRAVPQRGGSD